MNKMHETGPASFELGPIRPPSEAQSILLRLTRNCPWNKCAFCPVYKGQKYSPRPVEEVKQDIDSMAAIRDLLAEKAREMGLDDKDPHSAMHAVKRIDAAPVDQAFVRQVAYWMYFGMKSMFLQDADSLALKTDRIVAVLEHARYRFPSIERITTYARAKTVSGKTPEELGAIRSAGLNRIHIGMESGSDTVLDLVCKGVTAKEQIEAGKKAVAAGFELSEYYMPGLGGTEYWRENAVESAKVVNAVNPTFIRIRSVIPVPGTPLYDMYIEKKWTSPSEEDKVRELRLFIESLDGVTGVLMSDHIMNLLEDVEGLLPRDRDVMLAKIDSFLAMSRDDMESFILGRRMGKFRGTSDFRKDGELERMKAELKKTHSSLDEAILEILWNYI